MDAVVVQISDQRLREAHLVAFREEAQRDLRSAVVDVQAQQRVALRLADPLRQVVDERFGHLLDRQLHDHLLDRVAHLLQLNHRNDLEFQLLVVARSGRV